MSSDTTPFLEDDYSIGAGATETIEGVFDWYEVSAMQDGILLSVNDGPFSAPRVGLLQQPFAYATDGERVSRIRLRNPTGGTLTATVAVGIGAVQNTLLTNGAAIQVTASVTDGLDVEGTVAHDAAHTSKPFSVGGYAVATEQSSVAAADMVRHAADQVGRQIVAPHAAPGDSLDNTRTSNGDLIAAQGAGVRAYITELSITDTGGAVASVVITDGTITRTLSVAANGTAQLTFPKPLRGAANTAWTATITGTASVAASGYKSAV